MADTTWVAERLVARESPVASEVSAMTDAAAESAGAAASSLVQIAVDLARAVDSGPSDITEVFVRNRGRSGALISTDRAHPGGLMTTAQTFGRPHQTDLLRSLIFGVPTKQRALKIDDGGGLSLFQAIDLTARQLSLLCAPLGYCAEADQACRMIIDLGLAPCGWAVQVDRAPGRHRVRIYAMAEPDDHAVFERLTTAAEALAGTNPYAISVQEAWQRWGRNSSIVVNLELHRAQPPAVKLEFPDVVVGDVLHGLALHAVPTAGWWHTVSALGRIVGTDMLSHIGVRWAASQQELCAYIKIPVDILSSWRPR